MLLQYGGSSNQLPSNSYYSSAAPNRSSSRSAVDGGGGVGPSGGAPLRSYAQQYGPSRGGNSQHTRTGTLGGFTSSLLLLRLS